MGYAKRKHIEQIERSKQRRKEDTDVTDYGPTDSQPPAAACTHCWHTDTTRTMTIAVWPRVTPRVCCFCGRRENYRPEPPPIPEGHGPYYPRADMHPYWHTYTITSGTSTSSTHG